MTRTMNNATTRKSVLRSLALAAVIALGAALPSAGAAMAQDVHHDRGGHAERWRHREARPFVPVYAPDPAYRAPAYATPYYGAPAYAPPYYGVPAYAPQPFGAAISLPGVGLFFNIR